jgi:integrase
LRLIFEADMARRVERYRQGELKDILAPRTEKHYKEIMDCFEEFLQNENTLLTDIRPDVVEKYRAERRKKLASNGGSVPGHIAVLHIVFRFAVDREIMPKNPINLKNETKPGENPKSPARPLAADELQSLRAVAGKDILAYLLLRWTGLRGVDAVNLTWANVLFDQGNNCEIKTPTQKGRRFGRVAEIPLSPELREALLDAKKAQNGKPSDFVLYNPETGKPYSKGDASTSDAGRKKLGERIKRMGERVQPNPVDVTPHDFRDTFICDMLARRNPIFDVAKMAADTVETLEKRYAKFIPAAKDAVQHTMDHGVGIEERAKLNQNRGQKIVAMPSRA